MGAIRSAESSQPVQALQLANRVRRARSMLKVRVANGQLAAAEVILTSPSEAASMQVVQLLASQRGWGEARSRALLAQVAVPENKSIGSLTERQRWAVASQLTRTGAHAEPIRALCLQHPPES
jgi:hypothetical protein